MKYDTSYLFDYLKRVGSLSFKEFDFNIIDALILVNLSYYHFEFMEKDPYKELSLKEASEIYFEHKDLMVLADETTPRNSFLMALKETKRFKNLHLCNFKKEINNVQEKQFSAITIKINSKTLFVSFSGTDLSIAGRKEDFNLSFLKTIPSQISAKEYLNKLKLTRVKNVYIGGHSKGGALAMYGAYFAKKRLKQKTINVFNFDGPGLNIPLNDELTRKKIITLVPTMSVVGMIFNNPLDTYVVTSSTKGIYQHDFYSWIITKNNMFMFSTYLSDQSLAVNKAVHDYITELSEEDRREFIEICYKIISSTNAKDLLEFRKSVIKTLYKMIKAYNEMSDENKKRFKTNLKFFIKAIISETRHFKDEEDVIYNNDLSKFNSFKIM